MTPLAESLNREIENASPDVLALLSERGRGLYWPRGILSQTAEARDKAHRFNATLGQATEDGAPMALPSIVDQVEGLSAAEIVNYAPAPGRPELRRAWAAKQLAENPSMAGKTVGLPIVTHAITHGLSLVGDLFVDPGDRILLPDKLWGNYRLGFEVRLGAAIETFRTYDDSGGFDVAALEQALLSGPDKTLLLLNFPNNPTGYMPTRLEVEGIRDAVVAAAEAGRRLVVITDDAYFGLVYDDAAMRESPFGLLANIHPRVLTIKLDAATKELFVWGLRCGFMTIAPPPVEGASVLLAALEKKAMGSIRASISNCAQLSQSLVLRALEGPAIEEERREKFEILKARAAEVGRVVGRDKYRDSWDVYPFNAGYFMCIRVKGVDAEKLRLHLLDDYGVGLISIGSTDIRVAFSCLEVDEIAPLFDCVHDAIRDLR